METTTFSVTTGESFTVVDITAMVGDWLRDRGDGLCHLTALHATAGLALIETGSGSEADTETAVDRLLPADDGLYRHRHGSEGHGRDHVLPAFVSPSLTVAVTDGAPVLGTWQAIVLVDPNVDNPQRRVHGAFIAG